MGASAGGGLAPLWWLLNCIEVEDGVAWPEALFVLLLLLRPTCSLQNTRQLMLLLWCAFCNPPQPGWSVELRTKGDTVEAVFFHPSGESVGAFANARRMALQASKKAAA